MDDLVKTIGMQLAGDPRIQAQLRHAIVQGIGSVIALIKPFVLALLPKLGVAALVLAPVAIPVLLVGVAGWLISEHA